MANKAKNQNNTWWIILAIVLFLGAGYGGYRYWKSKQQPEQLIKGGDENTQTNETLEEPDANYNNQTSGTTTTTQGGNFSSEMAAKIKAIAALDISSSTNYNAFVRNVWNTYTSNAEYLKGDKYGAVACIQKILTIQKFYTGKIDGIWGSGTDAAVTKCLNGLSGKNNQQYSIKMVAYTGSDAYNEGFPVIMTWKVLK